MSEGRKQFTFFSSYLDAIEDLPRKVKGEILLAIAEYALRGNVPALTGTAKTVFTLVRPTIDKGAARSRAVQARWSRDEKDGDTKPDTSIDNDGLQTPYKPDTKPEQKEQKPNTIPSEERKGEGVGVGVREGKEYNPPNPPKGGARRFVPPTVEDVAAYCEARRNGIDPNAFVDFYTSKGWKVGKDPMQDWKAAVRTWERRDGRGPGTADKPQTSNPFLPDGEEDEN